MATNIIKIKRTTGATAPSTLNAGELAFSGATGTQSNMGQRLFIGDPANSNAVTVIGGNYFSNLMDHVHGTTTASSVLIVDANKSTSEIRTSALYLGTSGSDTLVTSTAAELNALDGITSTVTELNLVDGSIVGTVVASKAVIVDANKDIASFRNITLTGELDAATLDVSGNIDVDGVANLDNTDIDGSLTVDGAVDINATTFDIDATDDIDIDTSDTTGGIAIGTATSGVPISIGHTTSETTVNDNLTITGDLTVSGTTTTVNSTTVAIADPVFEIGESGSDDNLDRGIKMKYNSSGAKIAFMGYDDSDGRFTFLTNATDNSSVFSGSQGILKANIETGGTGLKVGGSIPFSDNGSGVLTLQNVDLIDATTEATIEAAIDTLSNLTTVGTITSGTWQGTTVAVNQGGTGLTSSGTSGFIPVSNGSGFVMQAIDGGTYS
jgi:cytoskeletal protein CcmA (bactofilin family)